MAILGTIGEFEHASVVLGDWQYNNLGGAAFLNAGLRSGLCPRTGGVDTNRLFRYFPAPVTTACLTSKHVTVDWCGLDQQVFLGFTSHELSTPAGGVPVLAIRNNRTVQKLELCRWNVGGASWDVLATSPIAMTRGSMRFDMFLENYGAAARVRVWGRYFNAGNARVYSGPHVLYIDFTGDVRASGYTYVDTMFVTTPLSGEVVFGLGSIIAATEQTHRYELFAKYITGAGDVNTMATGTYADIDELDVDTSDTANSDIVGQEILCAGNSMPTTNMVVLAVDLGALAIRGATGPQSMSFGVKTNAAEYWPTAQALDINWAPYQYLMNLNPVTGLAWDVAEVNALQQGAKSDT